MTDVLTLRLNQHAQEQFNQLRTRYFPPERNHISAHVTLFHTLPQADWINDILLEVCAATPAFSLSVAGLRSLGKGVAYRLAAPALLALQATLVDRFAAELSPQDRQRYQPHIVIQNKVTPEAARQLLEELQRSFVSWMIGAEGLDLWHYRGGPWEHAETFLFAR